MEGVVKPRYPYCLETRRKSRFRRERETDVSGPEVRLHQREGLEVQLKQTLQFLLSIFCSFVRETKP
jgi:hypothetical protein